MQFTPGNTGSPRLCWCMRWCNMEAWQIYIHSVCSSDCTAHWCGKEQTSVTLQYKLNTAHHTMPCTQMYGTQNTDCQCDCSHDAGIAGHTQLQSTLNFVTRGFVASMFLSNCRSKESTSEVRNCVCVCMCVCVCVCVCVCACVCPEIPSQVESDLCTVSHAAPWHRFTSFTLHSLPMCSEQQLTPRVPF